MVWIPWTPHFPRRRKPNAIACVLSAARIYGAIGRKVLNRGQLAWDTRTRVSAPEKTWHMVAAFFEAVRNRPPPPAEPITWSRHDFKPLAGW